MAVKKFEQILWTRLKSEFISAGPSKCLVPPERLAEMNQDDDCTPAVRCQVLDPYDEPDGVLADAECRLVIGDPTSSFWAYFILRYTIIS